MDAFDKLVKIFEEFPGIGPRQARRFVYFLVSKPKGYSEELSILLKELIQNSAQCQFCFRYLVKKNNSSGVCEICSNNERENLIMIVGKDTDFQMIEKSGVFKGKYFVLGGLLPILEKNPERKIRINELKSRIKKSKPEEIKEIILGLSATTEGENTAEYIKNELKEFNIPISELGRGISTGTEIEYVDKETIKAALQNKK